MKRILPGNTVLCGLPGRHYMECMFYTGFPSYGFLPSEDQIKDLLKKEKNIVVVSVSMKIPLPGFFKMYPGVTIGPRIFSM